MKFLFERHFDGFLILNINQASKKTLNQEFLICRILSSDPFSVANRGMSRRDREVRVRAVFQHASLG